MNSFLEHTVFIFPTKTHLVLMFQYLITQTINQNILLKTAYTKTTLILIFFLDVLINSNPFNPQFTTRPRRHLHYLYNPQVSTQDLRQVTLQDSRGTTSAQWRQRELTAKWLHLVEWFANKPHQQYLKRHIKRQEDKIANPPCNPTPL